MKQLSIIIPLYNCENYICQAIDSVICQKNVDYELIIIDDGSTDSSLKKITKYGDIVKIISIPNSGASAARNVGLRESVGKYVMFLDADDFLNNTSVCSKVISVMESHKSQMGLFSYTYYNNSSGKYTHIKAYPDELTEMVDCNELIYKLVFSGFFPASPCFRIIERDFLITNELYFKEGTTAEDIEWFTRLLVRIESFCVINDDSYIYRKSLQSSVTGSSSLLKCTNHSNMISLSAECVNQVKDKRKQTALLSALAYQYCILLSNCYQFVRDKNLVNKIKSLSWLLKYNLFPSVKYVRYIYNIFGFRVTSFLMCKYSTYFSKSGQ